MNKFSFPSKTFLLGEYAVLKEGKALMLAHAPCFTADITDQPESPQAFHEDCAAGKAAAKLGVDLRKLKFSDPHQGKGGFGGSGAEFLSVLAARRNASGTEDFAWAGWDLYRELGCTGSGADILTQGAAKPGTVVSLDIAKRSLKLYPATALGLTVSLFHTGHKLPTHQHLQKAGELNTATLTQIVDRGVQAFREKNPELFLRSVKDYASELKRMKLVAEHSEKALADLNFVPEVLAAKGCGALGSDVLLVCTLAKPIALKDWAKSHSLVEVASLPI